MLMHRAKTNPVKSFAIAAWRPLALRKAEAIVVGIRGLVGSFVRNATMPVYNRFGHRAPWRGWSRLSLDFEPEHTRWRYSFPHSHLPPKAAPNSALPVSQQHQISNGPQSEDKRPATDYVSRWTSRISDLLSTTPQSEAYFRSRGITANLFDIERAFTNAPEIPVTPSMVTRANPSMPRQEVPGGFPSPYIRLLWLPEQTPETMSPATNQMELGSVDSEGSGSFVRPDARSTTTPESQPAIQTLIERTLQPTNIADLQLKLAPVNSPSIVNRQADINSVQLEERENKSSFGTGLRPAAQQVDINQLADKVYETLMLRQQIERERRGLY